MVNTFQQNLLHCVWGHIHMHTILRLKSWAQNISSENESQDIWGLFHESSSNAAEVPRQTPSGVIPILFPFFLFPVCSWAFVIPSSLSLFYLCSVITCVPRADFWLLLPDTRLDGMLAMSADVWSAFFFIQTMPFGIWMTTRCYFCGVGGIHTTSDPRKNLAFCLVDVVVVVKWLGIWVVRNLMTVSNYSHWFGFINNYFSTFEEIFVGNKELLSAVLLPNEEIRTDITNQKLK